MQTYKHNETQPAQGFPLTYEQATAREGIYAYSHNDDMFMVVIKPEGYSVPAAFYFYGTAGVAQPAVSPPTGCKFRLLPDAHIVLEVRR